MVYWDKCLPWYWFCIKTLQVAVDSLIWSHLKILRSEVKIKKKPFLSLPNETSPPDARHSAAAELNSRNFAWCLTPVTALPSLLFYLSSWAWVHIYTLPLRKAFWLLPTLSPRELPGPRDRFWQLNQSQGRTSAFPFLAQAPCCILLTANEPINQFDRHAVDSKDASFELAFADQYLEQDQWLSLTRGPAWKKRSLFLRGPEFVALKGHSACGERTTLAPSSPPKLNQMCNEAGSSSNYFHLSHDRLHVNANACSPYVDLGCLTETPRTFPARLSFPCCSLALSYASITRQPSQFCHSQHHSFFFQFLPFILH